MKTAAEMYELCKSSTTTCGKSEKYCMQSFQIIEKHLQPDENVAYCFLAFRNMVSMSKHEDVCAHALTNKRILIARKGLMNEFFKVVSLEHVNGVTYNAGLVYGLIAVDTLKERFTASLPKQFAVQVFQNMQTIVTIQPEIKQLEKQLDKKIANPPTPQETLREWKSLLDDGLITAEEYERKRQEILQMK